MSVVLKKIKAQQPWSPPYEGDGAWACGAVSIAPASLEEGGDRRRPPRDSISHRASLCNWSDGRGGAKPSRETARRAEHLSVWSLSGPCAPNSRASMAGLKP